MIRRFAFVFTLITMTAAIALPGIANAQTEPEQPAPPPPPPPPPPTPEAPRGMVALGPSDHQEVMGAIGLQIARSFALAPAGTDVVTGVTNVGVRYWFNEKLGVDAGLGLAISHVSDGGSATGIGFGLNAGVPMAIGIYKHITTFFEPSLDFFLIKSNTDNNNTLFDFDVLGSLGFEWQLGWVEASRISLILRLGAGINLISDGTTTQITFATGGGSSVEGLFNTTLALAFYL